MNINCKETFGCDIKNIDSFYTRLTKKTFKCNTSCLLVKRKCCYLCSNLQCSLSKTSVDRFRFITKLALLRKDLLHHTK